MADNNVNEMKLAKFESFIEKIRDQLGCDQYEFVMYVVYTLFGSKINNYAKIIDCLFACTNIDDEEYDDLEIKQRIEWFKELVSHFKRVKMRSIVCIFIALMALAVDKTDYEERLSTVCDVAVMLEVTDDEMADIVQVVRFVYRDIKAEDVALKTESCQKFFEKLIPYSKTKTVSKVKMV
ncbi:MAG: hypothetical protein WBK46_16515 [Ruminococcus flavefaciens]